MACKYEEVMVPTIDTFVSLGAFHYQITKDDVLRLESDLLILLEFNLGFVSPIIFITEECGRKQHP